MITTFSLELQIFARTWLLAKSVIFFNFESLDPRPESSKKKKKKPMYTPGGLYHRKLAQHLAWSAVEAGINEDEVKRALGIIVIVWQSADEIIIYNNSRELKSRTWICSVV